MKNIKGTTKSGFNFVIEPAALDDMELLEALAAVDNGEVSKISEVFTRLLGTEQKKALYEHLRGKNGRVSTTAVVNELSEIFTLAGDTAKNSAS